MSFDLSSLKHFNDSKAAATFVSHEIARACREAVSERGVFHWVLAGGSTPELCYRLLRDEDLPWQNVHCWFGDERALPAGHPERNETMARDALLDFVPIPADQVHNIDFPDTTESAAASYAQQLSQIKSFDLVMLGMGEDGHTASLFPNNPALESSELAVPVFNSPKPPAERVTIGLNRLNQHRKCLILATGTSKAEVLQDITKGADLPVTRINNATWVVDQAAWPETGA